MFPSNIRNCVTLTRLRLCGSVRNNNLQRNIVKDSNRLCKTETFSNFRTLWSCSYPRTIGSFALQDQGKVFSSALLSVDRIGGYLLTRGKKTMRKETKRATEDLTDDESDEEEWEEEVGLEYKDFKARVPSLRLDSIAKSGLKMSRNQVEKAFYSSKIRVNEQKITKKSRQLQVGDEVDIIKGSPDDNPDMLYVARIVILKIGSYDDDSKKFRILLRRYNNLLIKKYEERYDSD